MSSKLSCLCLLTVALLITGCKTTLVDREDPEMTVPLSYTDTLDPVNSAALNWAEYFQDSVLVSLINEALDKNLDLLIAKQRIEGSRSDMIYAKGLLIPVVQASGAAGEMKFGEYSAAWAGNEGGRYANGETMRQRVPDYSIGFQSSWELDIWGKLRNKKKMAIARYLATMEGRNWAVTNMIAEIATAYYRLLALDNEVEIIRETIQVQENAVSMVRFQKEVGVATALAVEQFEARLLNLRGLEEEVLREIREIENRINAALGRFPQPILRNAALFNDITPERVHAGVPSELLRNRPDIRRSENELIAARADVLSARAAFFPSIRLTGGVGYNAFNPSYLFSTPQSIAYDLFGNLTAPVLNRSAIKAEFSRASAFQLEALYSYQKTIIEAFEEVSNELSNIRSLEMLSNLKAGEAEILNRSVETSTELFRTGRATYLEVLLAQQNALQSKLELTETNMRKYHAFVNVYKALGGGWR